MKLFFYKSLLIFFLFIIAFQFTVGSTIKKINTEIINVISKEKANKVKSQVLKEMENAINKKDYIKREDAIIINKFLEKIKFDLEKNK
jgi:hypothetical protein|tara:strand:+ start:2600 stop:2863 length:264 start_codon:yes stop_codon:yes gene_type:complete